MRCSEKYDLRLPRELRDRLDEIARRDMVSVASTMRRLLAAGVARELGR